MPNWCSCALRVEGKDQDLDMYLSKFQSGYFSLYAHVPIPEDLEHTTAGFGGEGDNHEFMELYGARNWYDWNVQNLGTKWDCDEPSSITRNKGKADVVFSTAWLPPIAWLATVSRTYPDLEFTLVYVESGASFWGVTKAKAGETQIDKEGAHIYKPDLPDDYYDLPIEEQVTPEVLELIEEYGVCTGG